MKSKKGYRKSQGHRQKLHKIQIEKIEIKASAKPKETE
jgi:ribosomal protein L21